MWLIIIWTWKELMPEYQSALGALFLIQGLIFIEYFFNYNETQFWATIGNHRVPLDLSMAKLIVPTCILIYHQIWRGK